MSPFAADPHGLIYLPPTMAPSETCKDGDHLEHPRETFAYFRRQGVERLRQRGLAAKRSLALESEPVDPRL